MPLYDIEKGCRQIDGNRFYSRHIQQIAARIDKKSFADMWKTVDLQICKLNPSESSQLTWTRCAALIGYMSKAGQAADDLWAEAFAAVRSDPDLCNKFVGSLIMWRVSLLNGDIWLTSKTKDSDKIHPWRAYWINNDFVPYNKKHSFQEITEKFNRSRL